MVFSSPLFLFAFLPAIVLGYFAVPARAKNGFLLTGSLAFYLVGAGAYTLVLLAAVGLNFGIVLAMQPMHGARRRLALAAALAVNMTPLAVLKYSAFGAETLNAMLGALNAEPVLVPSVFLPAGISFFAFQGAAYAFDVYRGQIAPSRSLINYALFISFFPQLIAGPIVRYQNIAAALPKREHSWTLVEQGLVRFGFGLGKKVLLADSLGRVADTVFQLNGSQGVSPGVAWLGVVCYTFQIFFDFSGYSDMAIGLGRVFGLPLPENFLQPYRAATVTEFWRRWHVTLSTWFRDYLYIPLGGNRRGVLRTSLNLAVVFLLCGLWHGAAWTFVLWGAYHGVLLSVERIMGVRGWLLRSGTVGRVRTMLLVMIGWVVFRAPSAPEAWRYLGSMVGANSVPDAAFGLNYYLTVNHVVLLLAAALVAFWPLRPTRLAQFDFVRPYAALATTVLAVVAQSPQTFNPFIYFQF